MKHLRDVEDVSIHGALGDQAVHSHRPLLAQSVAAVLGLRMAPPLMSSLRIAENAQCIVECSHSLAARTMEHVKLTLAVVCISSA